MFNFRCSVCGRKYSAFEDPLICPHCKSTLLIEYEDLDGQFDTKRKDIWRYRNILPVDARNLVSLGEGGTPLHAATRLLEKLNLEVKLFLKNETVNPTGSFMDRGSSVAITACKKKGHLSVSVISRGNFGASVAAYSAKAGIHCMVYIPPNIDLGKLYQTILYGAEVKLIRDLDKIINNYSVIESPDSYPILPNNPYFLEGLKTIAYEIAEQLNFNPPDFVIIPMGNGGCISMIWKGFKELVKIGLINEIPSLVGVQIAGADPIVRKFYGIKEEKTKTDVYISDISVENPLNIDLAIRAMKDTKGFAVSVSYEKVVKAVNQLASLEGLFVEPAAAATIAALSKITKMGKSVKGFRIVCLLTGSGLKDPVIAEELTKKVREVLKIRPKFSQRIPSRIGRTKLMILRILKEEPLHGYGIWKILKERGIEVSLPTVYQHLAELENMKLVASERREIMRNTRLFRLTERGKRVEKILEN